MVQPPDPLADIPSVDINVEDPTLDGYTHVVEWARARDLQRAPADRYRGVPITSQNEGWRRINLIFPGNPIVSLIINEVDGYLIGFRRGDGTWMRFNDKTLPNHVAGVQIGVGSSYVYLLKGNESSLTVGKHILTNGYYALASYDENLAANHPRMRSQRKALSQMILMFCESVRFKLILDMIRDLMSTEESLPLPLYMWQWIKNWSTLSKFALECKDREANGVYDDDPDHLIRVAGYGVNNREDIIGILGLILRSS